MRRGAAAESRGEPKNPGVGLVIPREGVESRRLFQLRRLVLDVIPREGVERSVQSLRGFDP